MTEVTYFLSLKKFSPTRTFFGALRVVHISTDINVSYQKSVVIDTDASCNNIIDS